MASSPNYKVYNPQGQYVAACKHCEDAAALIALYGDGATIRFGHTNKVWVEGGEGQPAGESYDHVALVVHDRLHAIRKKGEEKIAASHERFNAEIRKINEQSQGIEVSVAADGRRKIGG